MTLALGFIANKATTNALKYGNGLTYWESFISY
jgi:hypothetical protein